MLWNQAKWFIETAIESCEHFDEHVPDMKRLLALLTEVLKPKTILRTPVFACAYGMPAPARFRERIFKQIRRHKL